jgi:hypothetical protein
MSHGPREWPNIAAEARDRASEEADAGRRALLPLLNRQELDPETTRRVALAAISLTNINRLLESVGAQTRP